MWKELNLLLIIIKTYFIDLIEFFFILNTQRYKSIVSKSMSEITNQNSIKNTFPDKSYC